jgi:hypothetical protein
MFSVAFRAAFAFVDNLAVLALSRGITGVTPSRVAPGFFGSGNFPGFASLQPSGTLAITANSAIKKRQRLKFGLLSDKNTPDRWIDRTSSLGSDAPCGRSCLDPTGEQPAMAAAQLNETVNVPSMATIRDPRDRRDPARLYEHDGFPQSLDDNPTAPRRQNLFPKKVVLGLDALAWMWDDMTPARSPVQEPASRPRAVVAVGFPLRQENGPESRPA